eukprot:880021-Pyramimonas_sp.AAC.1
MEVDQSEEDELLGAFRDHGGGEGEKRALVLAFRAYTKARNNRFQSAHPKATWEYAGEEDALQEHQEEGYS